MGRADRRRLGLVVEAQQQDDGTWTASVTRPGARTRTLTGYRTADAAIAAGRQRADLIARLRR